MDELRADPWPRDVPTREQRLRQLAGLPPAVDCGCGYRHVALAAIDVIHARDLEIARLRTQLAALELVHVTAPLE